MKDRPFTSRTSRGLSPWLPSLNGSLCRLGTLARTAVAAAALCSSAQAATVISENFSSGASNFTAVAGGTWSVSSGRYVLSSPGNASVGLLGNISVCNTSVTGDYTASGLVRITGSSELWNDTAFIFGYQDSSNYYYVSLNESNDGNTHGVFKVVSGSPTELADFSSLTAVSDTDYTIQVARSGNSIVVSVNSSQVASVTDSSFSGGKFGFGSKNDAGQFDNLTVDQPQVATPGFSPAGGSYSSTQNVTITTSTSGATIRYTTNGSTPTSTSGTVYSSPVAVSTTTTLKAIAYKSGSLDSSVATATYTISSSSTPISENFASGASNFTVVSGGTWSVSGGRYVLSSPADSGTNGILGNISTHNTTLSGDYTATAVIRITGTSATWNDAAFVFGYQDSSNYYYVSLNESNDGNTHGVFKVASGSPTELADFASLTAVSDTDYTIQVVRSGSSIVVSVNSSQVASVTDSAFSGGKVGFGSKNDGGQFDDLTVTQGSGGGTVATPAYSPAAGTYSSAQSVTISTSTSGATIRYTTNGTNPTSTSGTLYAGPVAISTTTTLKAIAYKSGMTDSAVASGVYTITPATVAAPSFSPGGGTYSSAQSVTISTTTSGASIRYTTNGTNPTSTTGTLYAGPVAISTTTTLKAIAYKSGMSDSSVTSATYTISSGGSGPPTRVASFGPNGTHWPDLIPTPFMYDTSTTNIVDVACSWSAISSAISAVTSTQANQGVLIRVAPGTLGGNGTGSTTTPVLQNLGSASWSKRVTVAPRDGYGTVVVTAGARIFRVQSVCFAGFIFEGGVNFHANNRSALAWTLSEGWCSGNAYTGLDIEDVEFTELVIRIDRVSNTDTMDCFSNGANSVDGYRFTGCYMEPRYRPSGGAGHTDTLQFEPTSGGSDFTNVWIQDCAFFASTNCAIQVNAIDGLTVEHTYIAGGATSQTRYPFPSGADTAGANNNFNGGGINMEAYDSYFIGGISGSLGSWIYQDNTRTTYSGTNVPTDPGYWIVDSTLDETNPTMPPLPTDTYLDGIWGP